MRHKGVAAFLIIAFGASWGYWLAMHLAGLSLVNPLLQLPGAFFPAFAAIIVRRWVTREGFADAGLRLRARSAWPYYLAAAFGPWAVVAGALGLAAVFSLWTPGSAVLGDAAGLPGWALLLLLMAVVPLLAPLFWGEEFGWNSYLLQRVFVGRPLMAVAATGLIWAVWHYPLAFLGYLDFPHVALGLALWTMVIMLQEVVQAWLRIRSGSVWTSSMWHAGNNLIIVLILGLLLTEGAGVGETAVTLLVAAPMAVIAGWILFTRQLTTRATWPGSGGSGQPSAAATPTGQDIPVGPMLQ